MEQSSKMSSPKRLTVPEIWKALEEAKLTESARIKMAEGESLASVYENLLGTTITSAVPNGLHEQPRTTVFDAQRDHERRMREWLRKIPNL